MKATLAAVALCLVLSPQASPTKEKNSNAATQQAHTNKQIAKPCVPATQENPAQDGTNPRTNPDVHNIRVVSLPGRSTGDSVALICTIVLTVVGIIGIIVGVVSIFSIRDQTKETARAARAAEKSAKVAEASTGAFVVQNRPFISFRPEVSIARFLDPHTKTFTGVWGIAIPIQNTGNTPPKELLTYVNMVWRPGELEKGFIYPDLDEGGNPAKNINPVPLVVPPKATIYSAYLRISHDHLTQIEKRVFRLYLYGWARYTDFFPNTPTYRTEFCFEVTSVHLGEEPTALTSFHREHNCMDEGCNKSEDAGPPSAAKK